MVDSNILRQFLTVCKHASGGRLFELEGLASLCFSMTVFHAENVHHGVFEDADHDSQSGLLADAC